MAAQIGQDETIPYTSDMWKKLMRKEDNSSSLINDFGALQRNYNELRASLEFSQAKMEDLSRSNSALQTEIEAIEKNKFVPTENMSAKIVYINENLTAQRAAFFKKVCNKGSLLQG